ncbi:MAG: hypothetical protein AB1938_03010 [Myxococcota bacterium]
MLKWLARGALPAVTVAAALLVVAPWLDSPFHGPKGLALAGGAALSLALLPFSRRRIELLFAAPLLSTVLSASAGQLASPDAVWTQLAFGVALFAWASSGLELKPLFLAAVASGGVVSLVVLLQAARIDPFGALGPDATGRVRLYATLGNPDFVASALTLVLCLAVGAWLQARRQAHARAGLWLLASGALLAALAVTRSFATAAGLVVAAAVGALHATRRGSRGEEPSHGEREGATAPAHTSTPDGRVAGSASVERTSAPADARPAAPPQASADSASVERTSAPADARPAAPPQASADSGSVERTSAPADARPAAPPRASTGSVGVKRTRPTASVDAPTPQRPSRDPGVGDGRPPRRRLGWGLAGVAFLALLGPLLGRSPAEALQGRLYLTSVAAPHALDAPLLGLGPGAVEALWPAWEVEWWRARCGVDASCVAAHRWSRFAALQDHVHDDWLELLLERGLLGLVAVALVFVLGLHRAWRASGPIASALLAALAASATRAFFDFPLARPADLCLLAAVVGLALSLEE